MNLAEFSSLATAVGVAFAGLQVAAQRTQIRTTFQDEMWSEQRRILRSLPSDLLLGDDHAADTNANTFTSADASALYSYFDLCNEQAMFASIGRIGPHTWNMWQQSILRKMARPAFQTAWNTLGSGRCADEFPHLARVIDGSHRIAWRHYIRYRLRARNKNA